MNSNKTFLHYASLSLILLSFCFFASCRKTNDIETTAPQSGFVLHGKVVDAQSQPIADVNLSIVAVQNSAELVSKPDGSFSYTLDEDTPEWITIKPQKKGMSLSPSQNNGSTMMTGQTNTLLWKLSQKIHRIDVNLVMTPQPVLHGMVNLQNGRAASGAKVMGVFTAGEAANTTEWDITFTDKNGAFQMNIPIKSTEMETVFLIWDNANKQAGQYDVQLNTATATSWDKMIITLNDEVALQGSLLSSAGDILPDTTLQFYYRSPIGTMGLDTTATVTNKRGEFTIYAAPGMEIGMRLRDDNRQTISTWLKVDDWANRKATLVYSVANNELLTIFESPAIL